MKILLLACALAVFFLIVRFIQPELIYAVRRAVMGVQARKIFLDLQEGREVRPGRFAYLMAAEARVEGSSLEEERVRSRLSKIAENYRVLVAQARSDGKVVASPQSCIVELGDLVARLGRSLEPRLDTGTRVIAHSQVLAVLTGLLRGDSRLADSDDDDVATESWLTDNPISVEQSVELLIALCFAFLFRKRGEELREEETKADTSSPNAISAIIEFEMRVRGFLRRILRRQYGTTAYEPRLLKILTPKLGPHVRERLEAGRRRAPESELDLLDFLNLPDLETLTFAEWEVLRHAFPNKTWFKERFQTIVIARNDLAHGRPVEQRRAMLAVGHCFEIEAAFARLERSKVGGSRYPGGDATQVATFSSEENLEGRPTA